MEQVAVEILVPILTTNWSNLYILVVMEYFTKWHEAYAVPDQIAATSAKHLVNEMCHFAAPEELHCDQGRLFEAQVFQDVFKQMRIKKTTP